MRKNIFYITNEKWENYAKILALKDIVEHIMKNTALELLKINDIVHLMPDEL